VNHTENFMSFHFRDNRNIGYQDTHPNNKDPFDQWKAKSTDSTIPSSDGIGDTER
jgi:hypothetical protein